jgi:hypothetical protein
LYHVPLCPATGWDGASQTAFPHGLASDFDRPNFSSQVVRITSMSHWSPATSFLTFIFIYLYEGHGRHSGG